MKDNRDNEMKNIKEAIEIGLECARDVENNAHDAYSGYMPEYHEQADDNAHKIKEALIEFDSLIFPPQIGAMWPEQGGIYAGIVGGTNGKPDFHLIHAASEHEIFDATWHDAIDAAKAEINSFADWSLPDRREARLLAINSPDSFDEDCWYWINAPQDADDSDSAWLHKFSNGYQVSTVKSFKCRARAVRRVSTVK